MDGIAIRIFRLDSNGLLFDDEVDFELSDFGGVLPVAGDCILYPLVQQGGSRTEPEDREILTVESRLFNPRDMKDRVILICTVRPATEGEREFLPLA